MCRQAKKMTETVKWLGEMKHFCSLRCLMFFCSLQGVTGAVIKATSKSLATKGWSSYRYLGVLICIYPIQSLLIMSVDSIIGWLKLLHPKCFIFFSLESCTVSTGVTPVSSAVPQSTKEGTPVIANVVSLSSASNKEPGVLGNTDPKGDLPQMH